MNMGTTKKPETEAKTKENGKPNGGKNGGPKNGAASGASKGSQGASGSGGVTAEKGSNGKNGLNGTNGAAEVSIKTEIQACPFNLSPFSVLLVYCIIIFLTSSLYYNWPVFERMLIDDMVFSEVCTEKQREQAVPGIVVCEEQRDAIGNLADYVFYAEFLTYSIAGPMTDHIGLYPVMVSGYMFGFMAFLCMFFFHSSRAWLKMSFGFWGVFGGAIFITSVHLGRLFPEATSLADGMIIFFDNMCAILPVLIHKMMRRFHMRFYEALGSYMLWGLVPSFLLTLLFIPLNIQSQTNKGFSELGSKLANSKLWFNLIVFSIPVNCSVYYRKMFSAYFHYNQRLVNLFPLILLFVFVPTPFISIFNQFVGIHITSSVIYVFHIISFFCFVSTSEIYGIISIVLFAIVSSSSEQQTISYISEHYTDTECTLMGISYGVGFILGTGLQYLLDHIYKRSPRSALYVIAGLISISIMYSAYCHFTSDAEEEADDSSFKILTIILWFIPFIILCISLTINAFIRERKWTMEEFNQKLKGLRGYRGQKNITTSIVLGSFSLYYVSNVFLVLISIFKVSEFLGVNFGRKACIIFYVLFFILPHFLWTYYVKKRPKHVNITVFVVFLGLFKVFLLYLTYFMRRPTVMYPFSLLLFFYGITFFIFINLLAYYNFQITYVERSHFLSLVHWGFVPTMYFMLRFLHNTVLCYKIAYLIVWSFVSFFWLMFSIVLYLYFPYEIDSFLDVRLAKLPVPAFLSFDKAIFSEIEVGSQFYTRIINSSLAIFGLAVLLNLNPNRYVLFSLCVMSIYNFVIIVISVFRPSPKAKNSIRALDLFSTIVSVILFLVLLSYRIYSKGYDLKNDRPYIILSSANFVAQSFELQECCCNTPGILCSTCRCCCIMSAKSVCAFCDKTVIDDEKPCGCNKNGKCKDCVCKCLKRIILPDYTIAFYGKNFKSVDQNYLSFFIGTIIGWILFLVYLVFSNINITFYMC
ncbi:hypothetical protein MACJ_000358 [Theileria orientalis]|uniref:Uncharacterized protein n=1 Tax=Theileria orientalis TaxID=68886 RepID=A0A976M3X5_THEOR|nr:hypothetical protein MACJ_000358 [Theileria orientalis]